MPTTGPPAAANSGDRVHHRGEARDGARAQVVAVGEAAGHDDRVDAARRVVAVPQDGASTAERLDGPDDVLLAVRAGEQDDADSRTHRASSATVTS